MPDRAEATPSQGLVRRAIDFRHCPWVRPLVSDYVARFESVAPLFAGNPADPAAWRQTIARVQRAPRDRRLVAEVLIQQLERRGAAAEARAAAETLKQPATVAIVTGQQAGAFGGPLYTALKAVTAIQLARRVTTEHGVTAVPIFWVDAEDHDWDEIRTATVLNGEFEVKHVALPPPPGAGQIPVGSLVLTEAIEEALTRLQETLAPTEFSGDLLDNLRRRYRPGVSVAVAFAGWIDDFFSRHGLVVFEASDPAVKPAVADLFAAEINAQARTSQLVREAGTRLTSLGHSAQIHPADDSANLFYLDQAGRRPIRRRDGQYTVGDTTKPGPDLAAEATAHPERFSPNVVLRPLVQDRLFPTVCYVAGPSELAYQAQLGEVYRTFGTEVPLLYPRASATILDSAAARFIERYGVPFESLQARDESALNQLLERQLPPSIDRLTHDMERVLTEHAVALREAVGAVDQTLTGVVDTTVSRINDTLKSLHGKIVQASKKKDETLRRQFTRTRDLAFPDGVPQERALNVAYFVNRYGPAFVDRLLEDLPPSSGCHYLLTM